MTLSAYTPGRKGNPSGASNRMWPSVVELLEHRRVAAPWREPVHLSGDDRAARGHSHAKSGRVGQVRGGDVRAAGRTWPLVDVEPGSGRVQRRTGLTGQAERRAIGQREDAFEIGRDGLERRRG